MTALHQCPPRRNGRLEYGRYAVCQFPGCVYEVKSRIRRMEQGWYEVCGNHSEVFQAMSLGDIKATRWKRLTVRK
jgi:hypothetical protein